ncbi:MAG: MFS transporter [Candidatus Rifleibacteriota bacterium]
MSKNIILRNAEFRLLWLAQLVSFIGEGIFQTAMIWWVIQKTGSGTIVGLITSMSFLPAVLIGPFAGTFADRLQPKTLLIGADAFRAALMGFFALSAWNETLEVNQLFWLCGLLSASGVFHSPTTLTVIPRIMEEKEIDEAMALHTIVRDISKLAGPALGGMIIARWSVGHAFGAHSACLLLSVILVSIMKIPRIEREENGESVVAQLKAGFGYVWRERVLAKLLLGFGFLNLFVVPIIVLLPMTIAKVFVTTTTKNLDVAIVNFGGYSIKGSLALGISEGILAFGSVLTGVFFVKLFSRIPTSRLLIKALIVNAGLFGLFAVNNNYAIFSLGLFFLGGCFTSVNVAVLSLFQKSVIPEMKGRFFALVEVVSFALFPISLAASGKMTDMMGLPGCYFVCAAGILGITIFLQLQKDLSQLDCKISQ